MAILQRGSWTNPKGFTPCTVGELLLCSWVSVFWPVLPVSATQQREQRKTCTHMWVFCKGRARGLYCFQQMGVTGVGKGVFVSVCVGGACWSVFFLCLSTSELPLHLAGSRTSAKMRGHTPLFTHSLSPYLSALIYYLYLSICLSDPSFCHFISPPHYLLFW